MSIDDNTRQVMVDAAALRALALLVEATNEPLVAEQQRGTVDQLTRSALRSELAVRASGWTPPHLRRREPNL